MSMAENLFSSVSEKLVDFFLFASSKLILITVTCRLTLHAKL